MSNKQSLRLHLKYQSQISKTSTSLIVLICTYLYLFVFIGYSRAQEISLSVSPAIYELIIQPGKSATQTYSITNQGSIINIVPRIVYFQPDGLDGQVTLTQKQSPEWIKYSGEVLSVPTGQSKEFKIEIAPPLDSAEIDHNLTLLFESQKATDLAAASSSFHQASVGSNMLISVSATGNISKSAKIVKFTAPRIIDSSLGRLNYDVEIKNNGNSFWKPKGVIKIGQTNEIRLAPQNILSGSSRRINCLSDQNGSVLSKCMSKSPIGVITSQLEFTIDDQNQIYTATHQTISFPFVYSLALLVLLLLTRYVRKYHSDRKK